MIGKKKKEEKRKGVEKPAAKRELSEKELAELLSPKREIDLKITKTFEELPEKSCVIIMEKLQEYSTLNTRLVKYFVDKKMKGVYVTVNKDLCGLVETLKADGIQTENVIFIDAISRLSGCQETTGENYYYIDTPKDMVELSVAIEKAVQKIKDPKKFVIIDSISTLLVYNKESVIEKFVHSVAGKLRAWNAQGALILVESTKKDIVDTLAQFCDKLITI